MGGSVRPRAGASSSAHAAGLGHGGPARQNPPEAVWVRRLEGNPGSTHCARASLIPGRERHQSAEWWRVRLCLAASKAPRET